MKPEPPTIPVDDLDQFRTLKDAATVLRLPYFKIQRAARAGIIVKGDLLIYSNLSARAIFTVRKKDWKVQDVWPAVGNRPLGLCWADAARTSFWRADANLQILYRYDAATGAVREGIQLPEGAPVLHGCQLVGNQMYFTDDLGWICRFRMPV